MKYELVVLSLAIVLMLTGAVILVVGDAGAIGFALVAVGMALTALFRLRGVGTAPRSNRPPHLTLQRAELRSRVPRLLLRGTRGYRRGAP